MRPCVSFIVLFYRDAPTVEPVINALLIVLEQRCVDFEIIAIDDHSPDQTWTEIQRVAETSSHVVPLQNPRNLGVGGSFRTGVESARFDWIGYTDGDDQYNIGDLRAYFPLLSECDIVTGARHVRAEGLLRKFVSHHFNFLIRAVFDLPLRDTNSALKLFRSDLLRQLPSWSSEAFYDAEILVRLNAEHAARIIEIPIGHRARSAGSAGGLSIRNILSILNGMFSPQMVRYHKPHRFSVIIKIYCTTLAAALSLLTSR